MRWLIVFLLLVQVLSAEKRVEYISSFPLEDFPISFYTVREAGFAFKEHPKDQTLFSLWDPDIVKVLVMNHCVDPPTLSRLPWRKMVLFVWEPIQLPTLYYAHFARVYTWDDALIDNIKYFKFYYPSLMPYESGPLSFEEKKLCAMVVSNWTNERIHIVQRFQERAKEGLDIYGHLRRDLEEPFQEMYRGVIPGGHSGEDKRKVLQNYRFCLCFENGAHAGYITEKIFHCFAAGCIPIYWGAPNIREYIPEECFIDSQTFASFEELYCYLRAMDEKTYQRFLEHIQNFLKSEEAKRFSPEHFEETILEAITS